MKRLLVMIVCFGVFGVIGTAHASGVVTFEDLYPGYETKLQIPDGYGGFNWSDDFWTLSKNWLPPGSYDVGTIGYMTAYTANSNDVWFEGIGGKNFTFLGAFITAAWDVNEDVVVLGYLDGSLIHRVTINTHNDQPYWFTFNWLAVDKVEFQPSGYHLAIDNISHCDGIVPVPSTILLLAPALAGCAIIRRRFRE